MIDWSDTFPDQLAAMEDAELTEAFWTCPGGPGDPVYEAYLAEMERRGLNV